MSATYHRCTCCGREYTAAEWDALPGARGGRESCEDGVLIEWRNCASCPGTMAHDALPKVLSLLEVA